MRASDEMTSRKAIVFPDLKRPIPLYGIIYTEHEHEHFHEMSNTITFFVEIIEHREHERTLVYFHP